VTETGGRGGLLARYGLLPREIEEESFRRIEARVRLPFPGPERQVALRMVHAAGDPSLVPHLFFHPRAVAEGVAALRRGATVWVDVRMVAAGLKPELFPGQVRVLAVMGERAGCFGSPGSGAKLTRLARAVLAQGEGFGGGVFVCGNSPTALLALLDLLDAGSPPPALVVATCPGFVAAQEAKEELLRREVPSIAVRGTRGGSPLAAACLNALGLLARAGEGKKRQERTALLLVGHGSRLPEAAEGLRRVAEEIEARSLFSRVEVGFLQLSPPDVLTAASRCLAAGAGTVVVMPYFLHSGAHVAEDLPPLLERLPKEHPGVSFHLAPPLGFHPCLVEVVLERAFSALSADRHRALSSKEGLPSGGSFAGREGRRMVRNREEEVGRGAGELEAKTSEDGKRAPGLHHRLLRRGGGQGGPPASPGVSPGSGEHSPARGDQGLLLSSGAPPGGGGGRGRGDQGRR
jgi:precorrin-8X/cobalt-precorrin-8 methylmutase